MTYGQDYGQQNQHPQQSPGQQWSPQSWLSGQQGARSAVRFAGCLERSGHESCGHYL